LGNIERVASGAVNGKWAFGRPKGHIPAWEPGRGVQPAGNTFIESDLGFASHLDKFVV